MRVSKQVRAADTGFTVVELVVAAAILFFVVTGAITGIMFASQSAILTDRRSEALMLANKTIEFARNLPFDDAKLTTSGGTIPPVQTNRDARGNVPGPYTITTTVADGTYLATSASPYRDIRVTVSWTQTIPGNVTVVSTIAGSSITGDYNFGNVYVTVYCQDSGTNVKTPGATVGLTEVASGRVWSQMSSSLGVAGFAYVPSGSIVLTATYSDYYVDPVVPTPYSCVANANTNFTVQVRQWRNLTIDVVSASTGAAVSGALVNVTASGFSIPSQLTDSSGRAVFVNRVLAGTTYAVSTTGTVVFGGDSDQVTMPNGDKTLSPPLSLVTNPATVKAKKATSGGSAYLWAWNGTSYTQIGSAQAYATTRPYTTTFTIAGSNFVDGAPTTFYLTNSSPGTATNPVTLTAGASAETTVN
ncbi:MAG: hypothetical protein WCI74_17785 [Actinomycetes bacterium]